MYGEFPLVIGSPLEIIAVKIRKMRAPQGSAAGEAE
jgi:hypothetical protein